MEREEILLQLFVSGPHLLYPPSELSVHYMERDVLSTWRVNAHLTNLPLPKHSSTVCISTIAKQKETATLYVSMQIFK